MENSFSFQRLTSLQAIALLLSIMIIFTLFLANPNPNSESDNVINNPIVAPDCPVCPHCTECEECPKIADPSPTPKCNGSLNSPTSNLDLLNVCNPHSTPPSATINIRQIDPTFYAPIAGTDAVVTAAAQYGGFKICIWPSSVDVHVSGNIARTGVWDPHLSNILRALFNHNENRIFIDVGANLGYFSLMAAAHGHTSYAFEAVGNNMAHFARSIKENGYEDKIFAYHNAISDTNTWIEMTEDAQNKGGSGLRENYGHEWKNVGTTMVPSVTIDQVVGHLDVFIMKIDIEGMEGAAFNGAKRLITEKLPPFIFVELNYSLNRQNGCEMSKVVEFMNNLDYSIYAQSGMPGTGTNYAGVAVEQIPQDVCFMHKSAVQYLP